MEMGRLEAPARDKPGIHQHQRRVLRRSVAETPSYKHDYLYVTPLQNQGLVRALLLRAQVCLYGFCDLEYFSVQLEEF